MLTWLRASGGRLSRARNWTTDQAKARASSPVAIQPARGEPIRRPKNMSSTAPARGSSGMMPARPSRSRAFTEGPGPALGSALQGPEVVGGRRPPAAEDRHDDGQADRDLGRGDDEGEEHEHLAADVVERFGEGHEGE